MLLAQHHEAIPITSNPCLAYIQSQGSVSTVHCRKYVLKKDCRGIKQFLKNSSFNHFQVWFGGKAKAPSLQTWKPWKEAGKWKKDSLCAPFTICQKYFDIVDHSSAEGEAEPLSVQITWTQKNVCWMFLFISLLASVVQARCLWVLLCTVWISGTLPAVLPWDAVLDANDISSIALHMLRTHRLPLIYQTVLGLAPSYLTALTEIPWWERKTLKNCTPQVSCKNVKQS